MLRKGLAIFLAMIFFLLFPFGLAALTAQTMLLNPDFYKSQFVKTDVYSHSYSLMMAASGDTNQFSRTVPLSSSEMEQVLKNAIPREFVQRQTETVVDQVFAWLASSDPAPKINVPLRDVKARMPDAVSTAIEDKLRKLPPCPSLTLPRLDANGFPECVPLGINADALRNLVHPGALLAGQAFTSTLPDTLNLDTMARSSQDVANLQSNLVSLKRSIILFKQVALILEVALGVLLLLIMALTVGSTKRMVKWLGAILLISGLASLAIFLFASYVGSAWPGQGIAAQMHNTSGAWSLVIASLVSSIVNDFLMRLNIEAGITTLLGLVLVVFQRFLP